MQTILSMDLDREVASHGGGLPASLQSIAHERLIESVPEEQRHMTTCVVCHKKRTAAITPDWGSDIIRTRKVGECRFLHTVLSTRGLLPWPEH